MTDQVLRINSRASLVRYPDVFIDRFEVRTLAIADLWQSVCCVPAFAAEIEASIAERGLINPVIIVRLPREDMIAHFTQKGYLKADARKDAVQKIPDIPVINAVWGGTNRIEVIRRMGYTHVDCVILHSFDLATLAQAAQRTSYRKSKNEPPREKATS